MAYNPALPADLTKATAAEMRSQFHGVVDLIQAIPAGPPGPPGTPGSAASVTGAIVDNSDPANAVIRTDVVDGAPKLVLRDLFLHKDASPSQNLVDGNPGTLQQVVHDANPGFAYSVNLGAPADITTIKIAGNGVDGSFPGDVTVDFRYSDDGATWTVIGSFVMDADNGTLQPFTFPSVGAHQYWGFIVTGYEIPGHGSDASLSEMQGFDGITAVLAPEATAEVQAAAAVQSAAYTDTQMATEVTRANGAYAAQGIFTGSPMALPFGWNFLGFEAWDGATAYNPGDALTYNSTLYVAIAAHTGVPPDSNPGIWTPVPTFFDVAGAAAAKADAAQAAATAASSNNTNAVATLDTPFADPDDEALRQKMNEILLALRRS